LEQLGHEVWIRDAAQIRASCVHILKLLLETRFGGKSRQRCRPFPAALACDGRGSLMADGKPKLLGISTRGNPTP